jgi:undecaprenyl pyrophosphate synthase
MIRVLPERRPARRSGLTLLILADGNRRWARDEGYAAGARRVVAVAEHLATRPEVATMIAAILSPENIEKRSDAFFVELHRAFLRLGLAIGSERALIASGIRLGVAGDLDLLRRRGGPAASLAFAIEAAVELTAGVTAPRLVLDLAVGYGSELARERDVDILLRTGMEEEGAVRLSGLRPSARMAAFATTRLWPEIEADDIDRVIDAALSRAEPVFAAGHAPAEIAALIAALSRADLTAPLSVALSTHAAPVEMDDALDALRLRAPGSFERVAVSHWIPGRSAPKRRGPRAGAALNVEIVPASAPEICAAAERFDTLIAPGQSGPYLVLPASPAPGHATIHACESGVESLVAAIVAAARFSAEHPALLGADRPLDRPRTGAGEPAPISAERLADGSAERDAEAERFAVRLMAWAEQAGLVPDEAPIRRAQHNYALTAFYIHHRRTAAWDGPRGDWEARAELSARYMMIVAAGDEGIFDRLAPGEGAAARLDRLRISARYLTRAVRGEEPEALPATFFGAPLLRAIARAWIDLLAAWRPHAHPFLHEGFVDHLGRLYHASIAELEARPAAIDMASEAPGDEARARAERAVQGYLDEAAEAVGAGLLYRAVALGAPRDAVDPRHIAALDQVALLLDQHFRLANDLAGFLASPGADRDDKPTTCSILVPADLQGKARATAIVHAAAVVRRLSLRLGEALERAVAELGRCWPEMALLLQRGIFVGRRVYEAGHYTTLGPAEMAAIFAELERRPPP